MALTKTITGNHQYVNNALSPSAFSGVCEAEVQGSSLVVPHQITRPGVFTEGTPREGYGSFYQRDSNG